MCERAASGTRVATLEAATSFRAASRLVLGHGGRWLAQGPGDGGYGKRCLLHKVEEGQGPLSVFSQSLRKALAPNSSAQDCLWKGLGTTRGFYKSDEREL